MGMNPKLLAARRAFANQKATLPVGGNFDNSPWPEGIYTFEIKDSCMKEVDREGEKNVPVDYIILSCLEGDKKGRCKFPYSPRLDKVEGVVASAMNTRLILGDVVPGKVNAKNEFEVNLSAYLEQFEDLAAQRTGQVVEASIRNRKPNKDSTHLDRDGNLRQTVYIRRGLGEDAKGVTTETKEEKPEDQLQGLTPPKTGARKKVAARRK